MDQTSKLDDQDYVKQLKSEDFDVVMQKLIGEDKQRTPRYIQTWTMIKNSRPKEELMVQAAFESCAFKSALSCVAGMQLVMVIKTLTCYDYNHLIMLQFNDKI